MPETIASLEEHRWQLYQRLSQVGDFRPGSIAVTYRRDRDFYLFEGRTCVSKRVESYFPKNVEEGSKMGLRQPRFVSCSTPDHRR
jgi:hypothetical protein